MHTTLDRIRHSTARWGLALLVLASALAVSDSAKARDLDRSTTRTGKPYAERVHDDVGIPRFAEIETGVTRGGQPGDEGIEYLRSKGYRTVVSFRANSPEREHVLRSGMTYLELPIHAGLFGATPPTEEQVRLFLSVMADSSRRPVFIHCLRGKDRTGAMAAIYRMEACGWTADEAIDEMRSFGFSGRYRALMRFVRGYSRS
jgi:tyrosine-protein phosphatase SIW14